MITTPTSMTFWNLAVHNLQRSIRHPPWTLLNLALYALAPNSTMRRGAYASMWATWVCFYFALVLDPQWHVMIMRKQRIGAVVFYLCDVLLHWVPLVALHVPYRGVLANATGLSNVAWGIWMTNGTMDLSEAYAPLSLRQWYCVWVASVVVTIMVPL